MASLISIGQVFDKTVEHYRKHFTELIGISAWILVSAVPAAIAKVLEPFLAGSDGGWLSYITLFLKNAGGILIAAVSIWALIAIVLAVSEEATGNARDLKAQAKRARKLFFPYLWVSILVSLIMAAIVSAPVVGLTLVIIDAALEQSTTLSTIGGALLLFGGLFALVALIKYSLQYGFAPYALILDDHRGVGALKQSSKLVKGRWWATFFRFFIPKLIYAFVIFLANLIVFSGLAIFILFTLGTSALAQGIGGSAWFLITVTTTVLLTPLVAVTDFYIYDSLKKTR